jgi:ABC-type glutathione transport system ATPase component
MPSRGEVDDILLPQRGGRTDPDRLPRGTRQAIDAMASSIIQHDRQGERIGDPDNRARRSRQPTCDNRQNMLHCRDVSKRFGEFVALDNVSFDLAGGICALLGPNGAGKSTLLKILTGLLAPDRGEVLIAGCDVAKEPLRVKRMIGVLPEDLGVFDALTIEEHLELCGPVYGLSRQETRERTGALLRILGLEQGRYSYLDQCSQGMRKKTSGHGPAANIAGRDPPNISAVFFAADGSV